MVEPQIWTRSESDVGSDATSRGTLREILALNAVEVIEARGESSNGDEYENQITCIMPRISTHGPHTLSILPNPPKDEFALEPQATY